MGWKVAFATNKVDGSDYLVASELYRDSCKNIRMNQLVIASVDGSNGEYNIVYYDIQTGKILASKHCKRIKLMQTIEAMDLDGDGIEDVISQIKETFGGIVKMYTMREAKDLYAKYCELNASRGLHQAMSFDNYCKNVLKVNVEDLYAFISLDVESDGLWGKPFAISAVCYNISGKELEAHTWSLRNLDKFVKNEWVRENVLPALDFTPARNVVRHFNDSYEHMMKSFASFWKQHKSGNAIWHMGHVVEANLFKELHNMGYIGDWDAPYCPVEVSGYLKYLGYPGDSVEGFANFKGINIEGNSHDPLYDARVAARVYFYIAAQKNGNKL